MKRVVAMILAGGRGKRMDLLCYGRPKPVLPFAGSLRVIDFSLTNCVHSGISNMAALIDYQRQYMVDYLEEWRLANTGGNSLHILEPRAGSYKGTSDAVYQSLDYLQEHGPEAVLVLAGDHVYKMDYRKMLAYHHRAGADVTVGVIPVPVEEAHRFGMVTLSAEGRIVNFAEKPQRPTSDLASMGIYIFNREVLIEHLKEDSAQPSSPHDFGYAIIPRMVQQNKVFAYRFDGYWRDIGTVEAYYEANMELIRTLPSLSLNGKWPVFTGASGFMLPKLFDQGSIKRSIISPGCVIRGEVENSILSPGVRVEDEAVVRNSIIMANSTIGRHSVVDCCVLDERVNLGEFCYAGFGASLVPGDWDITVLGQGVTVPPGTAIGRNCKIFPGVKPSDFTANLVVSGSIMGRGMSPLGQRRSADEQSQSAPDPFSGGGLSPIPSRCRN